ncbi:S-layer homology domain-containing protein [Paenibacillus pasadenensis]|uniref:S-layer homology domain-containing protein n=1 Tax=Paenibacillus pasadenensis TaxID=217090 RepID=UPI00203ECDF0|nr:S-layer homology domain-containing protein [Paenibacillus pasadenensis]MCM3749388.1 S-layer homology domain-containing protein [Paenibacillus pasadenensis]
MKKQIKQTVAVAVLGTMIGGAVLLPGQAQAQTPAQPAAQPISASLGQAPLLNFTEQIEQAINQLVNQLVLSGYADGQMRADKQVSNAELLKMVVLSLKLEPADTEKNNRSRWYTPYVETAVKHGLIENTDQFQPNQPAAAADAAVMIAKALQRDVKSVQYWMNGFGIGGQTMTRGETAQLLLLSQKAIRSANAEITSIKALNKITLEVTFTSPLVLADEATDKANANFAFSNNLKLVNQPRLKTGSISTYIVPVQTMTEGMVYTTNYKGKDQHSVTASSETIRLNEVRQVTADTFEVDSFREDGVIDYGYLISAYSGGRGANAAVLDENNRVNGQPMQVIPSLAQRQATLTPENGQPITVSYVGFTQSTDGKQEPKFRLPAGTTLQPGVKYTVTSDWFVLENNTFTAQAIAPLTIASVEKADSSVLNVTLSEDPGDELFAYRSIQLKGSDGTTLTAQYKVQTRKGATGVFELQNNGKLAAGVEYEVVPLGSWAVAAGIQLAGN